MIFYAVTFKLVLRKFRTLKLLANSWMREFFSPLKLKYYGGNTSILSGQFFVKKKQVCFEWNKILALLRNLRFLDKIEQKGGNTISIKWLHSAWKALANFTFILIDFITSALFINHAHKTFYVLYFVILYRKQTFLEWK